MWNQTTCGLLRTRPSKPGVPATLCTQNSLKGEQSDSKTSGEGAAEEGVRLAWAERRKGCNRSSLPGNSDRSNVLTAQDAHLGLARAVGGGTRR